MKPEKFHYQNNYNMFFKLNDNAVNWFWVRQMYLLYIELFEKEAV